MYRYDMLRTSLSLRDSFLSQSQNIVNNHSHNPNHHHHHHHHHHRSIIITTRHGDIGSELGPEGQEGLTIIQYDLDDEYTPHCDGDCTGAAHLMTGRVATAVLYCQVAELGGATTFTKSDIFVKPKRGMATFFTYKGKNGLMDDGYTEHSGCPVLRGEKWITTAWMREGVSQTDPWQAYDPNGIRLMV